MDIAYIYTKDIPVHRTNISRRCLKGRRRRMDKKRTEKPEEKWHGFRIYINGKKGKWRCHRYSIGRRMEEGVTGEEGRRRGVKAPL